MSFRVTLAQMRPALGDLERNLDVHRQLVEQATADESDLIVFPELSLTGYFLRDLVGDVALPRDHPLLAEFDPAFVSVDLDLDAVRRARLGAPLLQDERLNLTVRELARIQAERATDTCPR